MVCMTDAPSQRQGEISAALRASRELGPEYDEALASSIVERIDATIEERVRHHVRAEGGAKSPDRSGSEKAGLPSNTVRMVLSLVLLGVSIPVTAIAAAMGGTGSLVLVWIGLIVFYVISVAGLRR